jgi:aspartate/methionine/tyrosine aminotransferase
MKWEPFALERYFAQYEFSAKYLLSCSDCESLKMSELLEMSDAKTRELWDNLKLAYTDTLGHPALREAIAEIYDGIGPENILVAVPEEGIFLLINALLKPGDHVVCSFPAYQSLYQVARTIGCEVSEWKPDENRGWHFDIRQLEKKLQKNTKLVVINFPHNPTGYVPTRADFKALIELLSERRIYLLSDEMYRFLEVGDDITLPSACELYDHAFSLFGLSKTFGLPGLRIGWIASRNRDLLQKLSLFKDYTTICNSAPSEILAMMALSNKDKIIAGHKARIQKNLSVLDRFFQQYPDCFEWNRPLGGSVCFPRLLASQDSFSFCEDLVRECGIMLVPSRMFMYGDNHVRIGYGRNDLPNVVDRFGDYLKQRFQ